MKAIKRIFIFSLALVMALIFSVPSFAHTKEGINDKVNSTASYLMKTVFNPAFGNVGGDWVVIALSQSGVSVPKSYYESYYKTVEDYVKSVNGVLHQKKYTDYSRTVLALTAMGYDATDVGGYNLVYPLGDFEKTIWQGINGPIWALLALDSGNYEIPENKEASIQATRDLYIEEILANQLNDGGWAFGAKDKSYSSDPDMTGMALSAKLSNESYRVYTLLGDGEIQEGQVWEAAMFAGAKKLDNLCVIVDNNGLQIDGPVDVVNTPYPIADKFKAFNFHVVEVADGNDFEQLRAAFAEAKATKGMPTAIIMKTVKGKGVSFMENQCGWHGKAPNDEEYAIAMEELKKAGEN